MEKLKANCSVLNVIKNFPEFDKRDYVESYETDESVMELFNQCKCNINDTADLMSHLTIGMFEETLKATSYDKMKLSRCVFAQMVVDIFNWQKNYSYDDIPRVEICGYHNSKGYILPVFYVGMSEYGLNLTFKNDFNEWVVAIRSDIPIDNFGVFSSEEELNDREGLLEGFPSGVKIYYSSYDKCNKSIIDNDRFITIISSDREFYDMLLKIRDQINKNKKRS